MSIEQKYATILKDYFYEDFKVAKMANFNQRKYRIAIRKKYGDSAIAYSILLSLACELENVDWAEQEKRIRNMNCLKAHYVGSEYGFKEPSAMSSSNFIKRTALYADTIILEEQILNTLHGLTRDKPSSVDIFEKLLVTVDYAIEFLSLDENSVFSSDSGSPICVIAPSHRWSLKNHNIDKEIFELTKICTIDYSNEVFGNRFKSYNDLKKYLSTLDIDRFLASQNFKSPHDGSTLTATWIEEQRDSLGGVPLDLALEIVLHMQRSIRVYALVQNGLLGSIPITNSKMAWHSMNAIIKNDNMRINKQISTKAISKDALIMNSLGNSNRQDYQWLGNVPVTKLSIMRERGELADLREVIGKGVSTIQDTQDDEFCDITSQVYGNIDNALRKHETELKDLKQKYRRAYGIDTLIGVSGSISFTSAIYQSLASSIGILAALPPIATTITSIAAISKDYYKKRNEVATLRKKPISILFQAKEDANNQAKNVSG